MAEVISRGKKRIMTNDGTLQISMNDNRLLQYDGTNYRFVVGKKSSEENKVLISKTGENVLNA